MSTLSRAALGIVDRVPVDPFPVDDPGQRATDLGTICFSDPAILNLCVYRGDTGMFRVTVTYADGTPVNVSTATWDADVRDPRSGFLLGSFVVTPVPGEPSKVDVTIPAAVSALLDPVLDLEWDLEMRLAGQVQTLLRGSVEVTGDVSRPTLTRDSVDVTDDASQP